MTLPAATLTEEQVAARLPGLQGWSRLGHAIGKAFHFANHHDTMAFVNAIAWISHRQDHHPELAVGYNRCTVSYVTHSAGGLTDKDFDCAARVDALFS